MYVYLVTNLIDEKKYVGAKINYDSEYYGSSSLIEKIREELGEKRFKKNFKKEILVDNINNWEECLEIESQFIMSLNTLAPYGYNQKVFSWPPSIEMSKRGGRIAAEVNKRQGTSFCDPEIQRKNRERCKELGKGFYDSKVQSENGKIGGRRVHELHPEECRRWSSKGGEKQAKEKTGMFAPEVKGVGGRNKAYTLFEIDGLIQRMTLGAVFGE